MENIAGSFTTLCESYINLADRFQQLDVDHMTLKSKIIPLLKTLKDYKQAIATLQQENQTLQQEKQALQEDLAATQETCKILTTQNEALKVLEPLLTAEMTNLLTEATEQAALVNETIAEIDSNGDPDLSAEEKELLSMFYADPAGFAELHHQPAASPASFSAQADVVPMSAEHAVA